ncbi:VOC family protein [Acetobacter sacchari]|uniref:VOC family protein n=1 Tax=Acetobacter sacchari TaxID=2661687 RepID=A0ABS3LV70_9PROT|nr:VOC family protein [Acetobacter sacchari]
MFLSTSTILYVDNPAASADFYHTLLRVEPVWLAPGFVLFNLPDGGRLGLWNRENALPAGADSEITLTTEDPDAVHKLWIEAGYTVIQPPTDMAFGRNVVVEDPDGHRLRAFRPAAA